MWSEIIKEFPVPVHENGVRLFCAVLRCLSRAGVVVVGSTTKSRFVGLGAGADGDPSCQLSSALAG